MCIVIYLRRQFFRLLFIRHQQCIATPCHCQIAVIADKYSLINICMRKEILFSCPAVRNPVHMPRLRVITDNAFADGRNPDNSVSVQDGSDL